MVWPCIVTQVFPHGALEVRSLQKNYTFKVNGYRVKPYNEMNFTPREEDLAPHDLALQTV
jgi:hypothetical protein